MLEITTAFVIAAALNIYILTGGADYGGGVWDWKGGRLSGEMQQCSVGVFFAIRRKPDGTDSPPIGERAFQSSDVAMRRSAPILDSIFLDYKPLARDAVQPGAPP